MKRNFSLSLFYYCKVETFPQKPSSRVTVSVLDVKMGHTLLCVLGLFLLNTLPYGHAEVSNRASLTLQPNWPQIFSGETITLRCEIDGGGDTQWTYEWEPTSSNTQSSTHSEYRTIRAQWSHSGDYRCKGRKDSYSSTEWSDYIRLTVSSQRPKAQLRADDRDIPVGGSVTLTCSVNPSSSGWKYFWYRGKKTSEPLTTPDVVFLSTGQIRVSQGGLYWCRGGRGDPVYYTEYSDPISINKIFENKAVVTLQPNWSEIYRGEKITLRCEIKDGGDTEWTYEWKTTSSRKPSNQNEHSIRSTTVSHSGEYSCKGRMKHAQQS
uniref:Ig-like domain-containing protein n=1 Tax=Dicentrarchus labrax TaxID=13489 RepID=A0A8C4II23_DICLA